MQHIQAQSMPHTLVSKSWAGALTRTKHSPSLRLFKDKPPPGSVNQVSVWEWLPWSRPGEMLDGTASHCTKCGWFAQAWVSFWCFVLFCLVSFCGQCARTCCLWWLCHLPLVMKHILWLLVPTHVPCSLPLFFKTTGLLGPDYSPLDRQRAIGGSGSGSFIWKPLSAISIFQHPIGSGAMPLMCLLRGTQSLQLSLKMQEVIMLLVIP